MVNMAINYWLDKEIDFLQDTMYPCFGMEYVALYHLTVA